MNMLLGYFIGGSLSIAGIGGLLSGIFARSLPRAVIWAAGWGVLEIILIFVLSVTSRIAPGYIFIAVFWGLAGWFAIGRLQAKRRVTRGDAKKNAST